MDGRQSLRKNSFLGKSASTSNDVNGNTEREKRRRNTDGGMEEHGTKKKNIKNQVLDIFFERFFLELHVTFARLGHDLSLARFLSEHFSGG